MQVPQASGSICFSIAAVLLSTLVILVFWPLRSAGMTGDDWAILGRVIHDSGPLSLLLHDHSQTYLYRPLAMSFWWVTGKLFSANAAWHYSANVVLHVLNSCLLFLLMRKAGATRWAALLGAALFAVHPVGAATTSWLSDRFDLLATAFVLAALLLLSATALKLPARLFLLAVLVLCAMGSKETAIILLPASAAWIWAFTPDIRQRALVIATVGLAVVAFVILRLSILGTWGGGTLDSSIATTVKNLLDGFRLWMQHAGPVVMGVPRVNAWMPAAALGVVVAAVLLLGFFRSRDRLSRTGMASIHAGLVLVPFAAAVQSPVTRLALSAPFPFDITTNLRFYYLPLAALLLLLTIFTDHWLRSGARTAAVSSRTTRNPTAFPRIGAAVCIPAIAALAFSSFQLTKRWASETGDPDRLRLLAAAVAAVQTAPVAPGCLVALYGTSRAMHEFPLFSDSIIKAQLPAASPHLDCIVVTERMPYMAFTSLAAASGFAHLPQRRTTGGQAGPYASAALLTWLPGAVDRCAWERSGIITAFRWNGVTFERLDRSEDLLRANCQARPRV